MDKCLCLLYFLNAQDLKFQILSIQKIEKVLILSYDIKRHTYAAQAAKQPTSLKSSCMTRENPSNQIINSFKDAAQKIG
jgi:hypothetical protein